MRPVVSTVKIAVPPDLVRPPIVDGRLGLLLLLVLWAPTIQAQSFQGLGDLPGGIFYSEGRGVSADGSVVVGRSSAVDVSNRTLGFRWTAGGGMQPLADLPGGPVGGLAEDVSSTGEFIVGIGLVADLSGTEAVRWSGGAPQGLGDLPGGSRYSYAYGVSGDGMTVVGESRSANGNEAFRWTPATGLQGLGDLPGGGFSSGAYGASADGSVIVGQGLSTNGSEAFLWTESGGLQGLGDLDGGSFNSGALAVSHDGTVIVGYAGTAAGNEAFRWTASGGMQGLGDLPGGTVQSGATDVSADGSVVLGHGRSDVDEPFIWTAATGMRALRSILEDDYGLDLSGWTQLVAKRISADGTVVVGYGTNPQDETEAWRAELPRISVASPAAGDLLIAGEPVTIRWSRSASVNSVDIQLLPDTLGTAAQLLDFAVTADSLIWQPGDTLFSRSARIIVSGAVNPAVCDTSDVFRIRPYHLARLNADSTRYVPFDVARHGWPFCNCQDELFHPDWWQQPQFNYFGGSDPFTFDEYDDDFPEPPINALPNVFADWPAYTRAFGADDAYWLIIPAIEAVYKDSFTAAWGAHHGGGSWGGSCSGMAITSLLAFGHRDAFGAAYPAIGPVEELHTVGIGDGVREAVNTLYSYWNAKVQVDYRGNLSLWFLSPRETLADLKVRLLADDRAGDGYLYVSNGTGAHAVVPYWLERISLTPTRWRVNVYDPNHPGDANRAVVVDSTANTWSYNGSFAPNPIWGGSNGMYVMDPITNYLQEAIPWAGAAAASRHLIPADGEASLYVAATSGATVTLTALDGSGSIGYDGSAAFNTIAGAVPDLPPVGGATPPRGFTVPAGAYTLTLSDAPGARVAATVFDRNPDGSLARIYSYGRADVDGAQVDQLTFDPAAHAGEGELVARSDDTSTTKQVTLRAILTGDPALERTLDVRSLALSGPDSVRLAITDDIDGPRLRLQNDGGAKSYSLRLREGRPDGQSAFRHDDVPLAAGAVHTARPVWAVLGGGSVAIDVDLDRDGVPDETLELPDQLTDVPGGSNGEPLPRKFALLPASPNPFNPQTTIRYDVAAAGHVRLAVYDARGRRVQLLVDGERPAGRHAVALDARGLASGVYLLRMTAVGGIIETQRITLVR